MKRETVSIKIEKTDRSGKPTTVSSTPINGCRVWPRRSAEAEEGRTVLSGWNVLFPASAGMIPPEAKIVVRGQTYEMFGNVADYRPKGLLVQCRSAGAL